MISEAEREWRSWKILSERTRERAERAEADLAAARQQREEARDEHAEFLQDLDHALGLEDGEEAEYSNPEGAAESIYIDVARAYKQQLDQVRDFAQFRIDVHPDWQNLLAILDAAPKGKE